MKRSYCHVVPPLWTVRHPDQAAGWIIEYIRHLGYEVRLLDLNADLFDLEVRAAVLDCWFRPGVSLSPPDFLGAIVDQHEAYIRGRVAAEVDAGCRTFGLLLLDGTARFAAWLSRIIKEMAPDAHVVVGGAGATGLYRLRRRYRGSTPPLPSPTETELEDGHEFDTWVLGEGEHTLAELLARLDAGEPLDGIRGLALTSDGPHAKVAERALIKDMNSLPHPTFSDFDLSKYLHASLPFQFSRGCAFARCSHCGLMGYARGFRTRSPAHAADELAYHMEHHGVEMFHFTDMGLNGNLAALEAFCDEIIARQLNITWQGFVQIRNDMTATQISKMVQAGADNLNFGFESGSDAVLKSMCKPYNAEDAAEVLRMTREVGGRSVINLMCGHPEETEEEFQRTLDFLEENAENIDMVASVAFTSMHIHAPLLDQREKFGVELLPGGSWRSSDGSITKEVRNERVHRAVGHLRLLGIPCYEAFWELENDSGDLERVPEFEESWLNITGVEISSPDPLHDGPFLADKPLAVVAAYASGGGLSRATITAYFLDLWGRLVFGTPPTSERLRRVDVHEEGWVRLAMSASDLPSGQYLLRLRVTDDAGRVLEDHLCREVLEMAGAFAPRDTVMTPHTWSNYEGRPEWKSQSPVSMVRVRNEANIEAEAMVAGEPFQLLVGLTPPDLDDVTVSFSLRDMIGRELLAGEEREVPRDTPGVETWTVTPPAAPGELCHLEVTLAVPGTQDVRRFLLRIIEPQRASYPDAYPALDDRVSWKEVPDQLGSTGSAEVEEVSLEQPGGDAPLAPGDAMLVRATLRDVGSAPAGALWLVELLLDGQKAAWAAHPLPPTLPESGLELEHLLHLNLNLEGERELKLVAGLWDEGNACRVGQEHCFILQYAQGPSGDRRLGAGILFAPHSLRSTG